MYAISFRAHHDIFAHHASLGGGDERQGGAHGLRLGRSIQQRTLSYYYCSSMPNNTSCILAKARRVLLVCHKMLMSPRTIEKSPLYFPLAKRWLSVTESCLRAGPEELLRAERNLNSRAIVISLPDHHWLDHTMGTQVFMKFMHEVRESAGGCGT